MRDSLDCFIVIVMIPSVVLALVSGLLSVLVALAGSVLPVPDAVPPLAGVASLSALAAAVFMLRGKAREAGIASHDVPADQADAKAQAVVRPDAYNEPVGQKDDGRAGQDRLREENLEAAVRRAASSLAVRIRFADAILSKVPPETESAAFTLMESLISLRDQADATLKAGTMGDSRSSVADLAGNARTTINSVRTALADMRRHDKDAASGLKALGQELASGMDLLAGIEEITERSRLIAFNMAVEAARIGSQGNGFKVIVNELRKLNDQTATFSKRVAELLGRFRKFNEALIQKSVAGSDTVTAQVEAGIEDEEKALETLLEVSASYERVSAEVIDAVCSMHRDLDRILESLQFQDITRQAIEGAQGILKEAGSVIDILCREPDSVARSTLAADTVEDLRTRYMARSHTRCEKEALQGVRA